MRTTILAMLAAVIGSQAAIAEPLGEAATNEIRMAQSKAFRMAVAGQQSNQPAGSQPFKLAQEWCDRAKTILAGFDPDPYWSARVEQCFGDVAAYEGDGTVACTRFKRARELLAKSAASGGDPKLIDRVRHSIDLATQGRC